MTSKTTNTLIIETIIDQIEGVNTPSELARFLSDKYKVNITRQGINQFAKVDRVTVQNILLREVLQTNSDGQIDFVGLTE